MVNSSSLSTLTDSEMFPVMKIIFLKQHEQCFAILAVKMYLLVNCLCDKLGNVKV